MLSHITGKTKREEATPNSTSFDILSWIRARRLRWVGHILRLRDKDNRMVKETLKVIYDNRQTGDILMDVDDNLIWAELQKLANDKDAWKAKVNKLRQAAQRSTIKSKNQADSKIQLKNTIGSPTVLTRHQKC